MRGLLPVVLPAFALGFGVAWWVKSEPPPADETEVARPKVAPRAPGRAPALQEHVITAETTIEALGDLRYQDEKLSKELSAIDPASVPDVLAVLAERAGYFGLDYEDEDVLEELLKHWYNHEPDAALVWVLALEPESDRERLLRDIVSHLAETDIDQAIELARSCVPEGGDAPDLPLDLQQKAADIGLEKLLELSRLSIGKSSGASGIDLKYPPDFDFQRMLDGLLALEETLEEGERLTAVPANLVEEWTRRDPQAAFEWVSEGHDLSFNDMDDFLEAYAEVGGDREVGELVGGIFNDEGRDEHERYGFAWEALSEAPRAETLEGFLEAASPSGTRDVLLSGLLEKSVAGVGGSYTHARRVIIEGMTPEQRIEMLSASDLSVELRRELIPDLQRLGHTDAEIEIMTADGG